jgi:hypothetical protein
MLAILLTGLICIWTPAIGDEVYDVTGDWTMDYFGIPMSFSFRENGTFEALIDMGNLIADDGSNSFTGMWTFDGKKLTISDDSSESDETYNFTWDGEKLSGIMYDTEVSLYRVPSETQSGK